MWRDIKIQGIAKIEKLVSEYNIWELYISPYAKFKIKIYVDSNNLFTGYTNIQIVDELGSFYCALGHGKTEEEALKNTILRFFEVTARKDKWEEEDFQFMDSSDF